MRYIWPTYCPISSENQLGSNGNQFEPPMALTERKIIVTHLRLSALYISNALQTKFMTFARNYHNGMALPPKIFQMALL
jgi:hypothetical protein